MKKSCESSKGRDIGVHSEFFPCKVGLSLHFTDSKVNVPGIPQWRVAGVSHDWCKMHLSMLSLSYSQDFDREVCPPRGILFGNFDMVTILENCLTTFIYLFTLCCKSPCLLLFLKSTHKAIERLFSC